MPEPNKRGRKTKLTPELQKKLCDVLATGNYIEAACDYVGIHVDTFYDWQSKNSDFSEAVKKARAGAELQSVARIKKAGQGGDIASVTEIIHPDNTKEKTTKYTTAQWQADAWYLERSYPNRWGRKVQEIKQEITGPNGGPVQLEVDDVTHLTAAERSKRLSVLLESARNRRDLPNT